MKTPLTVLFCILFILGALTFVPVEGFFNELTDSDHFTGVVEGGRLYEQTIRWTRRRILREDFVRSLEGTALQLDATDIDSALKSTFPEEWFLGQINRMHRDAVGVLSSGTAPERPIGLDLSNKRELLLKHLIGIFERKLAELPACDAGDALKFAATSFDVKSINCRPPEKIMERLRTHLQKSIEPVTAVMPSTLNFPGFYPESMKSMVMTEIRKAYSILTGISTVIYLGLGLLLVLIFYVNRSNRSQALFRTGLPLLIAGILLFLLFFPAHWIADQFLDMPRMAKRFEVDVTTSPFGHDLMQAEIRLATAFLSSYFEHMAKVAGMMFFMGVGLIVGGRMIKDEVPEV